MVRVLVYSKSSLRAQMGLPDAQVHLYTNVIYGSHSSSPQIG